MKKVKGVFITLVLLLVMFGVPYLIGIKWNYFGATLITLGDIIGLWVGWPVFVLAVFLVVFFNEKK